MENGAASGAIAFPTNGQLLSAVAQARAASTGKPVNAARSVVLKDRTLAGMRRTMAQILWIAHAAGTAEAVLLWRAPEWKAMTRNPTSERYLMRHPKRALTMP